MLMVLKSAILQGVVTDVDVQFALVDPAREWKVQNSWFMRQKGIRVTIKRRKGAVV